MYLIILNCTQTRMYTCVLMSVSYDVIYSISVFVFDVNLANCAVLLPNYITWRTVSQLLPCFLWCPQPIRSASLSLFFLFFSFIFKKTKQKQKKTFLPHSDVPDHSLCFYHHVVLPVVVVCSCKLSKPTFPSWRVTLSFTRPAPPSIQVVK